MKQNMKTYRVTYHERGNPKSAKKHIRVKATCAYNARNKVCSFHRATDHAREV